jgi:FMN phosphatase YigB (HAD superfamily)
MSLQGIIFDVEDTFFDGTFWHRYLHRAVCRWVAEVSFNEVQSAWQSKFLPEVYQGQRNYWDALASFFRLWGLSECEVSELLVASQSRMKFAQANLRLFPQVDETLKQLKLQGLRLGILCNSIHQPQALAEILIRIGVRTQIDAILTSRHLGRVMPDVAGFQTIAEMLNCPMQSLLYVSARESRLEIGREAEVRCIQVAKQQVVTAPPTKPIQLTTIDSLSNLGEVFERLNAGNQVLA